MENLQKGEEDARSQDAPCKEAIPKKQSDTEIPKREESKIKEKDDSLPQSSGIKIGRSVSLTQTDSAMSGRRGTTPSPKPKVKYPKKNTSVRDRKARFEDFYRNRGFKEITKGK